MSFVLKMAWRDSRASRRRLLLFSASIVLGIAALVAIGSFSTNLQQAVEDQAKGLLGADLVIVGRAAPSAGVQDYLRSVGAEIAREQMFSSMAVFPASPSNGFAGQVPPDSGGTRLVQVRAAEGNFPFYGDFVTEPADAPAKLRAGGDVAIVEETLLSQFGATVGGKVKLGTTEFTVVGALRQIPGESTAIAMLAPRIFIPLSALERTGLVVPGKEVLMRHRLLLKLPPLADPAVVERETRARFREERLSYDTVEERKRELGRALERIQSFLSLVGFVALFLGSVGVASAMHVYVQQKVTTVAILRCLGASARQSFSVYLLQGVALGAFGAVGGAILGILVQLYLPVLVQGILPFKVEFSVGWSAVAQGMIAGMGISILFTLLPLLAVRRVSPLVALRSAFAEKVSAAPDPWRIIIGVIIVVAVAAFAIWQTGEFWIGLGFAGMLIAGFGALTAVALGVSAAARRWLPRGLPYVARQGVANLYRPNNRTVLLLVALGLGSFLIVTLYLTRTTLLREIQMTDQNGRPNLVMFDIQDDQIEPLKKLAAAQGVPVVDSAPIISMKIAALKGQPVAEILQNNRGGRGGGGGDGGGRGGRGGDNQPAGWTVRREYRSTFRDSLTPTEKVVAGTFIGRADPNDPVVPISMEQQVMDQMALKLGDEITWDVQGVQIRSRIASVRTVEWRQFAPNFFAVFPAGVLESAPKFYIAAMRAPTPADSGRMQRAAVAAFPNVTAIDLALVMQTIDSVVSKVAFVIQFMALFTVATGIIVLAGSIMTGRYQRIRETVLLRTLGATQRQVAQIQLVEYAILGFLAAVMGCGLAVIGNALLAKFVFDLAPVAPIGLLAVAVLAVVSVTLTTGFLTSRGVTSHPPLEILRQET